MRLCNLRICNLENPVGYAMDAPVFSLTAEDAAGEPAWASLTVNVGGETVYRSGEIPEADSLGWRLDLPLKPRTRYDYTLTVRSTGGDQASAEAFFETGKRDETWSARWISPRQSRSSALVRKSFLVSDKKDAARLYLCGLGVYEAYLNGEKIGDEFLSPGYHAYDFHLAAQTYDVTALLREGENELVIALGEGWFKGRLGFEGGYTDLYGDRLYAIAELWQGGALLAATDESWEELSSPIRFANIYDGEIWDARFVPELLGRVEETAPETCGPLQDRLSLPVRELERFPVKEWIRTPRGDTVLDFGQNLTGWVELCSRLPENAAITLTAGEILQDGEFYHDNYRTAKSEFTYISDGRLRDRVRPHFTFFGFRYVRVTGWVGELTKEMFRGCVLYSDMDRAGRIHTGNAKIDRLYENTVWGLKSNFLDMPTDCPQRNERLGWTGDAQIFAPTASYHMDTKAFFHKFERDLMDEQGFLNGAVPNYVPNIGHKADATSAWGDIGTFLPMTLWKYYGDKEELAFAYPMMTGWVDYMDRLDTERRYTFAPGFQFGDWLGLDGVSETSFKGGTDDGYLGAVYYYQSARLTAEAAEILGKQDDAKRYGTLAENIKKAILDEYFTPNGRFAMDTQASYVVALKFGLWIDRDRLIAQFQERLKKDGYRIRCGFVGAPLLCTVLAECGLTTLAYDFLLKEEFPSWLYCVNLGATTIWERWNSVGPDGTISNTGMNSLNHSSYGSVMEFVYAYAAGIRPAEPGFRKAILDPHPDYRLPRLTCSFDSAAGKYVSDLTINPDGTVHYHFEVPFGCEALVTLPRSGKEPETYYAGSYDIRYTPTRDFRKPFDENTMISTLGENEQALGILFALVPPIGGMAKGKDAEFGYNGLADFRHLSFLPIDPEKLEQAIEQISNLTVEVS